MFWLRGRNWMEVGREGERAWHSQHEEASQTILDSRHAIKKGRDCLRHGIGAAPCPGFV